MSSFWERLTPVGDCLAWDASNENNRGDIQRDGKRYMAHQYAWFLSRGERLPKGLEIRHKCDRPNCCNPDHLESGTHAENMQDMLARRRAWSQRNPEAAKAVGLKLAQRFPRCPGEKHGMAKLTEQQAKEIKYGNEGSAVLAARYGVTQSAIQFIRAGRSWKHLPARKEGLA